jgi:MoxR-like ATPase
VAEKIPANSTTTESAEFLSRVRESVQSVIRGKNEVVQLALVALFARGHLLIEDVPGVGKTTLAHSLARSFDCSFQRIQFTSDMLPSDVIGISVFNQQTENFEFRPGPVFANIVLADEINRTTPKTQSALLEAMNEFQVTVDSHTYPAESEKEILKDSALADPLSKIQPSMTAGEVVEVQQAVRRVSVDDALIHYLLAIVEKTRHHPDLTLGVSPRGSMMLYRAAQAMALVEGRNYCIPDDIKRLVLPLFAHRSVVSSSYTSTLKRSNQAQTILQEIVESVPVPL